MTSRSYSWFARLYLWACQRLYTELAPTYDAVSWLVSGGRWSDWRRSALRYLPDASEEPLHVLELGFGTGHLLQEMARSPAHLRPVGVDLSPAMHGIAAARLLRTGLHVPRVCADARILPFADGAFHVVISTFPASYIFDPATLRECARVLRSRTDHDARLIIVGAWVTLGARPLRALGLPFYSTPNAATRRAIRERLAAAGFVVTETEYAAGWAAVSVHVARVQP